jgi:hypothetical protein
MARKAPSIETVDVNAEQESAMLALQNARVAAEGGIEIVNPDLELAPDDINVRVQIEGEDDSVDIPVTEGEYVTVMKHHKTGNFSQFNQALVGNAQFKIMRVHKDQLQRLNLR